MLYWGLFLPENKKLSLTWTVISASLCLLLVLAIGVSITASLFPVARANTIEKIGVYQDISCTENVNRISWGEIQSGSSVSQTVYIKNKSPSLCSLSLTTSNWTPSAASNCLHLGWNYSGQKIVQNEVIPIELTLTVSENAPEIANFSFNIIITSTQ